MNIIAVDDEEINLKLLVKCIKNVLEEYDVHGFKNPVEALKFAEANEVTYAFSDIEMFEMSGIEFAHKLKKLQPRTKLFFVTAHPQYALDAFNVHAKGYILKPVSSAQIKKEIEETEETKPNSNLLEIRCFGNFDCYYNGEIIKFERSKAKELLAFLVCNKGQSCSVREIEAVMFENSDFSDSNLKQIQVFYSSLLKTLKKYNLTNVLNKSRNSYSINKDAVKCDFFDYLKGIPEALNSYMGDFMKNYEWAFSINSWLENEKK